MVISMNQFKTFCLLYIVFRHLFKITLHIVQTFFSVRACDLTCFNASIHWFKKIMLWLFTLMMIVSLYFTVLIICLVLYSMCYMSLSVKFYFHVGKVHVTSVDVVVDSVFRRVILIESELGYKWVSFTSTCYFGIYVENVMSRLKILSIMEKIIQQVRNVKWTSFYIL